MQNTYLISSSSRITDDLVDSENRANNYSNNKNNDDYFEEKVRYINELKKALSNLIKLKKFLHRISSSDPFIVDLKDVKRQHLYDKLIKLPFELVKVIIKKERIKLSNEIGIASDQVKDCLKKKGDNKMEKKVFRDNSSMVNKSFQGEVLKIEPLPESSSNVEESRENAPLENEQEDMAELDETQSSSNDSVLSTSFHENDSFQLSFREMSKKYDTSFPSRPPSREDDLSKSGRISLDSSTGRRLSLGVVQCMESIINNEESRILEENEEGEVKQEHDEMTEELSDPEPKDETEQKNETLFEDMDEDPLVEEEEEIHEESDARIEEEEEDEIKQFRVQEIEQQEEDDTSGELQTTNNSNIFEDSADDSSFLLNDSPVPRIKSIFDTENNFMNDTKMDSEKETEGEEEGADDEFDLEVYCRTVYLYEIRGTMINLAVKYAEQLRGVNWIDALKVWTPPLFESFDIGYDDDNDIFDSFNISLWGAIVELLNDKFLKYHEKMNEQLVKEFQSAVEEMTNREFGPDSKNVEFHKDVEACQRVEDLMVLELDYRFDMRRALLEVDKMHYQNTMAQMQGVYKRYERSKLDKAVADIYDREKENLIATKCDSDVRNVLKDIHDNEKNEGF